MSECVSERLGDERVPKRLPKPGTLRVIQAAEFTEIARKRARQESRPSRQFAQTDSILREKASYFYGMHGFAGTITSRFRILDRAMSAVVKQNTAGIVWRDSFDAVPTIKQGETYQKAVITLPADDGEEPQSMRAGKIFAEFPDIRAVVTERLTEEEDPAMHIVDTLTNWEDWLTTKPLPHESAAAARALDTFLFSVHGPRIVAEIDYLLNPQVQLST